MSEENGWRRCSSCKSPIAFEADYWVCSVSTCNRKRTGLVFCSVSCWDAHLPVMRHREAWAEERVSPDRVSWAKEQGETSTARGKGSAQTGQPRRREATRRRIAPAAAEPELPREILIVASKLKDYIHARSGMNTSDKVMATLSDRVRAICDRAIDTARRDERKTVLDRDVPQV